jgi:molybdenum cofactor synthesis domain-containing protein
VVAVSDRREFRDLATPAELREIIAGLDLGGGVEWVPLDEAAGRTLAERVTAELDVPGFDRAAMDGYAIRAADTAGAGEAAPVELNVIGSLPAGQRPDSTVEPGTAVEIATGAVLPPGADAVVMVEATSEADGDVLVRSAVAPGDHVMAAGADVAAGERALGPGTSLTAREIGLLAALGREAVPVHARPAVGIVSTGAELVPPGEPLNPEAGEIYDVNSHTIATAVSAAGGEPTVYPHVGDNEAALEEMLTEAADACDLVLTSGSTSASTTDVIYRVVEDSGELLLHGVAVKPGKPTLVGRIGDAAYVGLPGYPVSALTIFRVFVAPAIRDAAGQPTPQTIQHAAEMAVRERFEEGRLRFVPVGLVERGDGTTLAYPVDKGSGATTSLVDADGVVSVDPDTVFLESGEAVSVELFSPAVRPPTLLVVGEDDPVTSRALDDVEGPRYLHRGSRGGVRSLRRGIADVAVLTGSISPDSEVTTVAEYSREWGLVVASNNPLDVTGVGDLLERDITFANRDDQSGLRASFDTELAEHADATGRDDLADRASLAEQIRGYDLETRATESPARRVERGVADAGLGLRSTAEDLGLGFVSLGVEPVRVVAAPDRTEKPGVEQLETALESVEEVAADRPR